MKTSSWLSRSIKMTAALALATVAIGFVDSAKAIQIDYASTSGSFIHFDGLHHFSFTPSTNNFQVGNGSCVGCLGEITGTFTIGTITQGPPGFFTAPVTGSGTFVIHDGLGNNLTATLTWVDIQQHGTAGNLNVTGAVNLSSITYAGTNPDLVALRNAGSASNGLSFTFNPAVSLQRLRNGPGSHNTSFSGTISTVPDGGMTVALLGIALAGVGGARRIFRARKT
jgi:hypothetical protein